MCPITVYWLIHKKKKPVYWLILFTLQKFWAISCLLWCWCGIVWRLHFQYPKCSFNFLSERFSELQNKRVHNWVKTFILGFWIEDIWYDYLEVISIVLFASFGASFKHGRGWWGLPSGQSRRAPCRFGCSFQKISEANRPWGVLYWYSLLSIS